MVLRIVPLEGAGEFDPILARKTAALFGITPEPRKKVQDVLDDSAGNDVGEKDDGKEDMET